MFASGITRIVIDTRICWGDRRGMGVLASSPSWGDRRGGLQPHDLKYTVLH